MRGLAILLLVFASLSLVFGQDRSQDIAKLDKLIAHYKQIEARQAQLHQQLQNGSVVMGRLTSWSELMPLRTADIRNEVLTTIFLMESKNPSPNYEAAEKLALVQTNKYIASCRDDSREKLAALPQEMSQIRTLRQVAERTRQQLKTGKTPAQAKQSYGGTWTSSWGKMVLTQSGHNVTGTFEHRHGKIDGTVNTNGEMNFRWTQDNGQGFGTFKLSADGKKLTGTWNYSDKDGNNPSGGGTWSATRQ